LDLVLSWMISHHHHPILPQEIIIRGFFISYLRITGNG